MVLLQLSSFLLYKEKVFNVKSIMFKPCSVGHMSHTNSIFKYCNCSEIPSLARTEDYHFNNRQLHHLPYRSKAPLHSHLVQVTKLRC